LIKTGGLADVAGSLPLALGKAGADVRVLLPAYPSVMAALASESAVIARVAEVPGAGSTPAAQLLEAESSQGLELILIHCPAYFDRPGNPYVGADGKDWPDNELRFGLFSRIAALLGSSDSPLSWQADIVHGQDWQSALAPVFLKHSDQARAASVMTIHNLAYQGVFEAAAAERIGLPPAAFAIDGAEFYGKLSFLKGGLACADAITTVSPTYAQEICTEALGFGLQGLLSSRSDVLTGILNGVDTAYWNPESDTHIVQRYGAATLEKKRANKRALQAAVGLDMQDDAPLLGVVSRLVEQKGIDLIADILPELESRSVQLVVQGLGDKVLEKRLLAEARKFPRLVCVRIAFDEPLAHMIEAGADIFLMPSRFEPCGMNQMYSQRYGTIPIVRSTGGLADSVTDAVPRTLADASATGFAFDEPTAPALLQAVERALALYRDRNAWQAMQRAAMARDFSWDASAKQYLEVYQRVLG
jgi:starch synthase